MNIQKAIEKADKIGAVDVYSPSIDNTILVADIESKGVDFRELMKDDWEVVEPEITIKKSDFERVLNDGVGIVDVKTYGYLMGKLFAPHFINRASNKED